MMRKIQPKKIEGPKAESPGQAHFPSFNIQTEYAPEVKEGKIGKNFKITLLATQTGISLHKHKDNKEYGYADFDIKGIEILPHKESSKVKRYV